MTAAAPFPVPPDRVLSAWRRELAAFRPGRLRLAHLLLHRVEVLVRVARIRTLDAFRAALLGMAASAPAERLGLDREVMGRWLGELAADGLLEANGDGWRLTGKGRRALETGAYAAPGEERRAFTFLDEDDPKRPPSFLALPGPAAALSPPPGWRFDAAALESCVGRPAAWKEAHGFPADVEAVVAPGPETAEWRRVILDRPEQILLVLVSLGEAPPQWLGFAVRPEGWALQSAAPALVLPLHEGRVEALPALTDEPSPETWREAWRGWLQARGLAGADADACRVEPMEDRVRVTAPRGLAERMSGDRNEAWLLAGAGRVRTAAPVEVVAQE